MIAFDDDLAPLPAAIAELAADPEAARWARDCAWLPGTGHCLNRRCSTACLFRTQREAEAMRLIRSRRQRRRAQRAFTNRMVRGVLPFLLVLCLIAAG